MLKTLFILISIGLVIGFITNFYFSSSNLDISAVEIGENSWQVEVVSKLGDRVKGLGFRDSLEEGHGMLFIFPKEDFHGIWMKDMNFPIDIIWLSSDLEVVGLKINANPESYPEVFRPVAPAKYALEIPTGEAQIEIGAKAKFR